MKMWPEETEESKSLLSLKFGRTREELLGKYHRKAEEKKAEIQKKGYSDSGLAQAQVRHIYIAMARELAKERVKIIQELYGNPPDKEGIDWIVEDVKAWVYGQTHSLHESAPGSSKKAIKQEIQENADAIVSNNRRDLLIALHERRAETKKRKSEIVTERGMPIPPKPWQEIKKEYDVSKLQFGKKIYFI